MALVVWSKPTYDLLRELPLDQQKEIAGKTKLLEQFPRMYPVRGKGRFRRHRWFQTRKWIVYYRVVENTVYIRGLWPTHIP